MGDWNEKNTTRLKELATGPQYFSNSDIALTLNREFGTTISRNAVIGKKDRLGISGREPPKPHCFVPTQPRALTMGERIQARALDPGLNEQPHGTAENVVPVGQRCSLLELNDSTCRWPIGDVGTPEFYFCGGKPAGELPYCAYHARIAYTPRVVAPKAPWIPSREKRT